MRLAPSVQISDAGQLLEQGPSALAWNARVSSANTTLPAGVPPVKTLARLQPPRPSRRFGTPPSLLPPALRRHVTEGCAEHPGGVGCN